MRTLAERLKWAHELSKLSQRAFSRALGLPSDRHVGFLLSGDRDNLETKTLQSIASALGVSLDWLVNGDPPAPDPETVRRNILAASVLAEARLAEAKKAKKAS
jgi:transcriptional regulator with XRE-family HTH domain